MGHDTKQRTTARAALAALFASLLCLALASSAQAAPAHPRREALDITGLNHACGAAVDSKGDLYLSSAGESKVKVYDPSHNFLTSIEDANQPCGLAVSPTGVLYVSEKATGEVVQFKPNAYPFAGTPTYGARTVIDASTKAKGIAVDRFDGALYVAEGNRVAVYVHELQSVVLAGAITGGTFKLKFEGQETTSLSYEAKAPEVQAALEALSTIGAGNVEVAEPLPFSYSVFFTGKFAYTDVPTNMSGVSSLTGTENPRVSITETAKGFSGQIGEGTLSEASGVAAYSAEAESAKIDHYLAVADAKGLAPDSLVLFSGQSIGTLKPRRELNGATTPDGSFGFGAAGTYLAADPGTVKAKKCATVGEEACTAGHIFLFDAAHKALDEFDGAGEYLDRATSAAFADGEPTAIAVDRSGGANDGTVYVTAGAGTGAEALAFRPLAQPSRETLSEPISHILKNARAVATDSRGYVYAAAGAFIHVYKPDGTEITTEGKALIEDIGGPRDLAVDSTCKVYVLDGEAKVTYYTPSACPPVPGTTYTRRAEPAVALGSGFPAGSKLLKGIAVNPGPASGKDHLFVTGAGVTREYDSAANGSGLLKEEFANGLTSGLRQSIAVNGANGNVYIGTNSNPIYVTNPAGTEVLARIDTTVSTTATTGFNPLVAVDQASGHVIEFDGKVSTAREYDAVSGAFVAEFGNFTEGLTREYRVAVDNACATHVPKLTGSECEAYDPANGNVYVAFADTSPTHPPFEGVNAFGPLKYGTPPPPVKKKLTVERAGTGTGKVTSPENDRFEEPVECPSSCSPKFEVGTEVPLEAKADPESKFLGWSGACSGTEPTCTVTMSEDRKVTAEFEAEGAVEPLEVEIEGPGSGEVTSVPAGIACEPTCEAEFAQDSTVELTATPDPGSKFLEWEGACTGTEPSCEVTMSEAKKAIAVFGIATPSLTVALEGNGTGEVTSTPAGIDCEPSCEAEFELNQEVELEAKADPGSVFIEWGGACSGAEPSCKVKMTEVKDVTATFTLLPKAIVLPAQPVLYGEATLRGEVDPSGLQTEYSFEYLTQAEYEAGGETFAKAKSTPTKELAPSENLISVQADVGELTEGTEYRFRLRAHNAVGATEDEGTFETLQRRAAESCPNAEYRFGLSANLPDCRAYELATPAQTDGLIPYAAANGGTGSGSFSNWLTVQRGAGAGERLSYFTDGTLPGFEGNGRRDGYRAERGAGDHPPGGWQSALFSPGYLQAGGGQPQQLGVASDQLYSGWQTQLAEALPGALSGGVYLRTPVGFEALGRGSLGTDLGASSRYLGPGGAHVIFSSAAHLEPEAPPGGNVALYDRAAGSASAHVLSVPPGNASAEEEAEFEAALRSKEQASFSGASEDGATVAFKAGVGLYAHVEDERTERISPRTARVGDELSCAEGPLQGVNQANRYFQWLRNSAPIEGASGSGSTAAEYTAAPVDAGKAIQCLVFVLEGGTGSVAVSGAIPIEPVPGTPAPRPPAEIAAPTPANPAVGTTETCNPGSWQGAESLAYQWYADGEPIAGASAQTYEVQAADVPGTLQCVVEGANAAATIAKASGLTPTSPAPAEAAPIATAQAAPKTTYAGISEDSRYLFFALGEGESPGRLFRFDTQSEDATEIAADGIFALISPDGSHAFFSSEEAIGDEENENGEEPEAGAHNLYAWDGAGTRFVGRLAAADFGNEAFGGAGNLAAWTLALGDHGGRAFAPTRSTPGGGVFAFQSHAQLTAYDNEGVGEIYRYDPAAEEGEQLLCLSCDPSGAPPSADALLEDFNPLVSGLPITPKTMIANLTEKGQEVIFQSFDRLLPEDVNEVEDVYEWRVRGSESPGGDVCRRPGGCLALISSGQGETPSFLYAMSGDGHDVFFQTKERLVGMDVPGSPSIYDARVFGGIPEPSPPAPCQGDACQGVGTLPPNLPAPASTGGGGGGGEASSPPSSCAKGKHRVKGRCVAAKHHKRHAKKHRRASSKRGGKR